MFPKLSPFGEAFRRNGYKFPGKDEDFVKQDQIPLGQEAYRQVFPDAVWPGTLPASAPLALGFNGFVPIHPNKSSGSAQADNGAVITLQTPRRGRPPLGGRAPSASTSPTSAR